MFNAAARASNFLSMPGVRDTFTWQEGLTTVNLFVK